MRSTERKEYMLAQLRELGLHGEFVPATDGTNLEPQWEKRCRSNTYNMLLGNSGFYCKNEIACFASHYRLWKRCIEINEPIIILEDDIVLASNFKEQLSLVERLVTRLNYLRLTVLEPQHGVIPITQQLVCYPYFPCGTQGYAITPSGARCLIKHAKYWSEPVDMYLDKYWVHGLRPYCIEPKLITLNATFHSYINEAGVRANKYLEKPTWWVKLCREILVRPLQQLKCKLFEIKRPIIKQGDGLVI